MKSKLLLCAAIVAAAALADGAPTTALADTVVVSADRMLDVLTGRVVEHPQITITDRRRRRSRNRPAGGSAPR